MYSKKTLHAFSLSSLGSFQPQRPHSLGTMEQFRLGYLGSLESVVNITAVKLHMRTVMDDLLLQTRKIKVRRSFLQFLKLEVSKAETHTHWCSGLYPPSVSLHSYFFYTLHCGVMKSSVNLAVLAVIILCCVHGGVAGKY